MKEILLALLLLGGEPKVTQDPPKPTAGSIVFLSVAGEKVVKLSAISSRQDVPCRTIQEVGNKWVIVTQAPSSGGLTVILAAVDGSELHHWRHEVITGPEPTPPGPVPPVPPGPADPLTATFQAAYNSDPTPTKATDKADLVLLYRKAASEVATKNFAVAGEFHGWMGSAVKVLLNDRLLNVRKAVAAEMQKLWPAQTTDPMNVAKAKESLGRLADALEGVK